MGAPQHDRFSETSVNKYYAVFKSWYSIRDFECNQSSNGVSDTEKFMTPYSYACLVNNLTRKHKVSIRDVYKVAWVQHVRPLVGPNRHRIMSWPALKDVDAWASAEILTTQNTYADSNIPGKLSYEWKALKSTPASTRLDERPTVLFYLRSVFAYFMLHGVAMPRDVGLELLEARLVNKHQRPGPGSATELWIKLRKLGEGEGKIGDTALFAARRSSDASNVSFAEEVTMPVLGQHGNVEDAINEPEDVREGNASINAGDGSDVQQSVGSIESSQASPVAIQFGGPGENAFSGCTYIALTCTGKAHKGTTLKNCCNCNQAKRSPSGPIATVCTSCIYRKLLQVPSDPPVTDQVLTSTARCRSCWQEDKLLRNAAKKHVEEIGDAEYQNAITRHSPVVLKNPRASKRACLEAVSPGCSSSHFNVAVH